MANRLCKDTSGSFVLCGLQENVTKMIKIAQLDSVIKSVEKLSDAEALLNQ